MRLDFEAGLTVRYRTLMDVVRAGVEHAQRQKQRIADDLHMSPSEFSRKLSTNPNDQRPLRVDELDPLIAACGEGGKEIIYWLVERHLADEKTREQRAAAIICALGPLLIEAAEQLHGTKK